MGAVVTYPERISRPPRRGRPTTGGRVRVLRSQLANSASCSPLPTPECGERVGCDGPDAVAGRRGGERGPRVASAETLYGDRILDVYGRAFMGDVFAVRTGENRASIFFAWTIRPCE